MKKKIFYGLGGLVLILIAGFLFLDLIFPFPTQHLHPPTATVVKDREGKILRIFLPPDGARRFHTDLERVSPVLKKSLSPPRTAGLSSIRELIRYR